MKTDSTLVILDVHNPYELEGPLSHFAGTVNIPVQDLEKRVGELDKFKNNNIVVICRTGNRSTLGTKILRDHGFKAKNVLGGMTEFREEENK